MLELIINQNAEGQPEIFETVQGEGLQAGIAAIFIRLQGCDVHCSFCDEKDTWVRRENNSYGMSVKAILDYITKLNSQIKQIIITGGEPTQQELRPLIEQLMQQGYKVAIETAATGSFANDLFYDYAEKLFVTFSPKEPYSTAKIYNEAIWNRADEIKFVVANAAATDYVLNTIIPKVTKSESLFTKPPDARHASSEESALTTLSMMIQRNEHNNADGTLQTGSKPIFLVADWFNLAASKELAWKLCREYPHILRMGFQSHKLVEMP